jgi:hypothetical protein
MKLENILATPDAAKVIKTTEAVLRLADLAVQQRDEKQPGKEEDFYLNLSYNDVPLVIVVVGDKVNICLREECQIPDDVWRPAREGPWTDN